MKDAVVALDPAVEILDVEVDDCALLCHTGTNVAMAVPPGEGLLDFVRSLMGAPVRLAKLRKGYDDRELVDEMVTSLVERGFAHVMPEDAWPVTPPVLRRAVVVDLDASPSLDDIEGDELRLVCARLSDHNALFAQLERAHHIVVRAKDVRCDDETRQSLCRLGAFIEIDDVPFPAPPRKIAGLAELTRACVPVHAVMTPGPALLDKAARAQCIEWARGAFVSGLLLRLEAKTEKQFVRMLEAARKLEAVLGDVAIDNMPGDEVLLGNTDAGWLAADVRDDLRRAYLRWRIPIVKNYEESNPWSQIPAAEDKWIRAAEDLLPNRPELLGLKHGDVLVDTCGGMGRVARRLAPAVGDRGVVISIEMRRLITERARRFAYEGRFPNLQFRVGLAQRLPLPDGVADAAVNEWTGAIWELGLGPAMLAEMARVVRRGGRIAVTHRLVQLQLDHLHHPWVQYDEIVEWVREAFRLAGLTLVSERVWGQLVPSKGGQPERLWLEQYMPRLVDPNRGTFPEDEEEFADVYLTVIAEKR